ncbi:MAG TPA: hypothetical protein VF883_25015 [Thermoanaerobaculia bacterium]|jgi:ElaB/YqjD/DUF883 family membrane-anchored ribosome-binding protein
MDTTRDLQMPSGSEVESATFHPHVHVVETSVALPDHSGMRGKLDTLKSRGLSKVHDIQRVMNDRSTAAKTALVRTKSNMRDGAKSQVTKMEGSMRMNPMLWAGVAAGAGFGLGLIGRIAQWRSKQRHYMPELVIIERGC